MRFRINLELLRKELLKKNKGDLRALIALQYPIICIHAEVLDSTPDALDKVDRLLLSVVKNVGKCTHNVIHEFTNLERGLIRDRARKLTDEEALKLRNDSTLEITSVGERILLNDNDLIERYRNVDFYFDGVNLLPIKKEFIRKYGEYFVLESDGYQAEYKNKDGGDETKWVSNFKPDIIHEVISMEKLRQLINEIPQEKRDEFGIPSGLKQVIKYTFTNLTFPTLIALSDQGEKANKFIVNGMDFYGKTEFMGNFKLGLEKRIQGIQIKLENSESKGFELSSNWDMIDKYDSDTDRIFNIPNEDLRSYMERELDIKELEMDKAISGERINELKLTRKDVLNSKDPKGIIDHLLRGRHSVYGNPYRTSVYQFWVNIEPADEYMREMKRMVENLRKTADNPSEKADVVLHEFGVDPIRMREMLILSGNRRVLEEIDMREFIG